MPIGSSAQYAAAPTGFSALAVSVVSTAWTVAVATASSGDSLVNLLIVKNDYDTWTFFGGGGLNCSNTNTNETTLRGHTSSFSAATLPFLSNPWSTLSNPDSSQLIWPASYHDAGQDYQTQFRMPASKCPSPDTDGLMSIIQPNGWSVDTYGTVVLANGDTVSNHVASYIDLKGDGTGYWNGRRASMIPALAGLIRTGELAAGKIQHALAINVPPSMLKQEADWPAFAFDRNSGYSGTLPMGALFAIPPTVDLTAQGLSAKGLAIGHALQDYGAYIVDRGGGGISFYAELGNPDVASWSQMSHDMPLLKNLLQHVTNNTESTPGGGGTPRVPLAPGFGS